MKDYSQLTLEKRYGIYSLHKIGQTQLKIAKVVGFHKSRCDITIIKATPNDSKKDYILYRKINGHSKHYPISSKPL